MNKIAFRYIPVGQDFGYNCGVPRYRKLSVDSYLDRSFNATVGGAAKDVHYFAPYQVISFCEVAVGEECWWVDTLTNEVCSRSNGEQKYVKVGPLEGRKCDTGCKGGFSTYTEVVVQLPRKQVGDLQMSDNYLTWMHADNLCKLEDLHVGDKCVPQGCLGNKLTLVDEFDDTFDITDTSKRLRILVDDDGNRYFAKSTQQVYKKPVNPPKLMLSQLLPGTHFEFKHLKGGEPRKEYIKLGGQNDRLYYRDSKNNLYWLSVNNDREVVESIPF